MASTQTLLDPTGEHQAIVRKKAPGDVFLNRLDERLTERGITVKRYAKPTPSRLATLETRQKIQAEAEVAVIGLAD
jgi:hypothetical protein